MRSFIVAASLLVAGSLAAQAQNSSNRLMFDPNGMGSESRKFAPQSATTTQTTTTPATAAPATTTGQSVQQQPAARQTTATQPQPAPKQAAPKPTPRTTASAPARRAPQAERTVNDNTAAASRTSAERPVPREQQNLGRVSLPQGTLGYEGKTQMQTYDMSDGRRVPGYDNIQRNDSSYFGLSLRMPTFGSPSSSSSSSSPSSFGTHGAN